MLALALSLAAAAAGAASLGRIVVHSAIGDPFRADIEILALQEGTAPLALRISGPDAYERRQLQYPAALNGARIQFVRKASGAHVAEVVGTRAVSEPWLQLLVEMDDYGANIARAYTLLIDPPSVSAQTIPMVASAADAAAAAAAAATVVMPPAPVAAPAPVKTAARAAPITASRPAPVAAPKVATAVRPSPPPTPAGFIVPAAMAAEPAADRELKRLESLVVADRKTIADMLERVAAMERTVAEMQRWLQSVQSITVQPRAEAPVAAVPAAVEKDPAQPGVAAPAPAPAAQAPAVPTREQASATAQVRERHRRSDALLNDGLLVIAGGMLVLMITAAYWLWVRPRQSLKPGKSGQGLPDESAAA